MDSRGSKNNETKSLATVTIDSEPTQQEIEEAVERQYEQEIKPLIDPPAREGYISYMLSCLHWPSKQPTEEPWPEAEMSPELAARLKR